jgi:predicted SnoaL-like aldol condensation-catalyzing enzyme
MASASAGLSESEHNKALLTKWFEEVWNQGRRETIFELMDESAVIHDGALEHRGPQEFERFYDMLRARFSDIKIEPLIAPLAEDDRVCSHWRCTMTEPKSKKVVEITGTSVVRVVDGKFVEGWQNWDAAHLYGQLTGQAIRFE